MSALDPSEEPPELRLKDLRAGLPPVHVLGRVVTLSRKELVGKSDGRRHAMLSGLLSDGTATVRFTWWDPPAEGIDRGTVLRAVNAQVREFRQRPELSFGWSTRIQPASELELPAVRSADLPLRHVADLSPRDDGFRLEVRVDDVAVRTVSIGEERRAVHSGHLSDGTGSVPFTAWIDLGLHPGDTVRVAGGYVRLFRGTPEVTLDERSHVEGISSQLVAPPPTTPATRVLLGTWESRGGGADAHAEGLVVGLGSPSGVVDRCVTCARILQGGICRVHGAVTGTPDLRLRPILDDGTGVATVNLDRRLSEELTGRSLDSLVDRREGGPDMTTVEQEIREQLLGRRLRVRGRARLDEYGLSFYATQCEEVRSEPGSAIDALAHLLGGRPR